MSEKNDKATRNKDKADAISLLRKSKDQIKKESSSLSLKYRIHYKSKP